MQRARPGGASRRPEKDVIVEAITRLNIGGPGRHVLGVAEGLRDRYEIRVVTGTAPEVEGELPSGGATVDRLPMVRSVDPRQDGAATVAMRRLLSRHGVRLVHSHTAKAGAVTRVAAAAMANRPRMVHTFHGHVFGGYFSPRAESFFAQVERRLARRADRLIAVSAEVRDALLDLGIGRPTQYEVLPPGVDLQPYLDVTAPTGQLRATLGIGADEPLVGVAARLAPIKDHGLLLDAMAELPGVHLAVLGHGERRAALEAKVSALGIRGRVHFTGWCHDMAGVLADLDIAVLTSRNEGTPMSLIEASAAGLPIVATRVGGVADVVIQDRTGLLVPPGDAGAVAAALRCLLNDPRRGRELGRAGRFHVTERFGLRASLDSLSAIYDELLTGTAPH